MKGKIAGEVVDVRLAFSGKVVKVHKHPGDSVRTGDWLVSLERKELQAVLDKELADYEKVRAEFEIFVLDNPNPADDKTKYQKVQAQAMLNSAVKAVELAKMNLDNTDLKSPVEGIVLDNSGVRAGMNITPGSYSYKILDTDSVVVETETEDMEIKAETPVKIKTGNEEITGKVSGSIPDMKGKITIRIKPDKTEGLKIGSDVEIEL